jgi:hypothetical protein
MSLLKNILYGISNKINSSYSDKEIYNDSSKQDFTESSFFIKLLRPKLKKIIGNRYFYETLWAIHYISNDSLIDVYDIAEKLSDILEYIEIVDEVNIIDNEEIVTKSLLRGTGIEINIIDGVLILNVNFNLFINKEITEADLMETLEYEFKINK